MTRCVLLLSVLAIGAGACVVDRDDDGFTAREDCDDDDPSSFPGAPEICDGADNDCDGTVDDPAPGAELSGDVRYDDLDGDGFGDPATATCDDAPGRVGEGGDCNDDDPAVSPAGLEVCSNGVDDDCDGRVDLDPDVPLYADDDADGFGDPAQPVDDCPAWAVANDDDCDDDDPSIGDPESTVWFEDRDGDGAGAGDGVTGCTAPGAGQVRVGGDCDDDDPDRSPLWSEWCDGVDNDCDGIVDGPGTALDGAWAARLPLTVTAPSDPGAPAAVDVDWRAELDALGLSLALDPAHLRAVTGTCTDGDGLVELPVAFLDDEVGLLEAGGGPDPVGDEHGAVVVLWDTDGDLTTVEPWPADPVEVVVYLDDSPPPPVGWSSGVAATAETLDTSRLEATLDPGPGGLLDALTVDGGPVVASQMGASGGNGLRTTTGPLSATAPTTTDPTVVSEHLPVTAAVTVSGEVSDPDGATSWAYTYRGFAGRPELWVRPRFEATAVTDVLDPTPAAEVTRMLRPLQLSVPLTSSCTTDPGLQWADASVPGAGVTWVWAAPPTWSIEAGCTGGQTWAAANDYRDVTGMASGTILAGTAWADGPVLVLLPHDGDPTSVEDVRDARMALPAVEAGAAEVPAR